MILWFKGDTHAGTCNGTHALPSHHFFCPSCGVIWARILCEPGDYHRVVDNIWCPQCARTNEHGIYDGLPLVHHFPELFDNAPLGVLKWIFLQAYRNRVRLNAKGVRIESTVKYWPDNSELLARLTDTEDPP